MNTNRDYIQFIDHLIALTQNNEITWVRRNPTMGLNGTEIQVDFIYTTSYKDKYLRVYEETYKNFTDEFEFYWAKRSIIEFTTDSFDPLWQFPVLTNSYNLLYTIKHKDAGVDDFISRVLRG